MLCFHGWSRCEQFLVADSAFVRLWMPLLITSKSSSHYWVSFSYSHIKVNSYLYLDMLKIYDIMKLPKNEFWCILWCFAQRHEYIPRATDIWKRLKHYPRIIWGTIYKYWNQDKKGEKYEYTNLPNLSFLCSQAKQRIWLLAWILLYALETQFFLNVQIFYKKKHLGN